MVTINKESGFQNGPGLLLRGAYFSFHRYFHASFTEGAGITADQYVLMALLAEESGISQKELGSRAFSDANTTTNMLKLLERRGLVERKTDTADRRAILVYLTPRGRKLKAKADVWNQRVDPALLEIIGRATSPAIMEWLKEVATAFSEDNAQRRKDRPAKKVAARKAKA